MYKNYILRFLHEDKQNQGTALHKRPGTCMHQQFGLYYTHPEQQRQQQLIKYSREKAELHPEVLKQGRI